MVALNSRVCSDWTDKKIAETADSVKVVIFFLRKQKLPSSVLVHCCKLSSPPRISVASPQIRQFLE